MNSRSLVRLWVGVIACILIVGTLIAVLPLKGLVERRLKEMLLARHFENVELKVSKLGFGGIGLRDVKLGGKTPLQLDTLNLSLSPVELFAERISNVAIDGLTLTARKENGAWTAAFLIEDTSPQRRSGIPVSLEALGPIPFERLSVKGSTLRLVTDDWQLNIPFSLAYRKTPTPAIELQAEDLTLETPSLHLTSSRPTVTARLDEAKHRWEGLWQLPDIGLKEANLPKTSGNGTLIATEDQWILDGVVASDDDSYHVDLHVLEDMNDESRSVAKITEARLPWGAGKIETRDVVVPLGAKRPFNFTIMIEKIALQDIIRQLGGKGFSATGTLSGTLPITVGSDGSLNLDGGQLKADTKGMISIGPGALPGDNEQLAVVRSVLKGFNYDELSLNVGETGDGRISMMMKLTGRNPDAYQGKAVTLNVHLSGDLLTLVERNLTFLNNPQKLLKQGLDEKN